MAKILVTGAMGFIGGYVVEELLKSGYEVIGVDNFSKYGKLVKNFQNHPKFSFVEGDAKDVGLMKKLIEDCEQVVALAAMVGGISYFHVFPYDLLAENERIMASTFDAAIWAYKNKKLKKINVISSSMVYENTTDFPSKEDSVSNIAPPLSTYGFQKLAVEYFCKGAFEQYGLPYTIIRPFNCVGTGEYKAAMMSEGNLKLAMGHVVPDLVLKVLQGQNPLHILGAGNQIRHYTYGKDIALGIKACIENKNAINESFNISSSESTTVLELAEMIWNKINKDKKFEYVSDTPYKYDVQKRVPSVEKAKNLLGYEATTSLNQMLDIVIPWVKEKYEQGAI